MSTRQSPHAAPAQERTELAGPVLDALGEAVGKLRYGVVQLTVHEGRIVQLEVTEKHRF
ncbi:YezD family protein [Novosphingobium sp.]|uniref:YezD family protein n=1 Tax=Novosphingobium sp. TaxID=1874826 RepID=UPI0035B0BC88